MSTSSAPVTVGPTPPTTTDPASPPLEPPAPFQTQVAGQDWQPPPTLIASSEDTIVGNCVPDASADYYFLNIGTEYVLRDIGVGTNYNLTGLVLNGFYYLDGNRAPLFRPDALRVSFGDQEMTIRSWAPAMTDFCAQFTFNVRPDEMSGIHGPLRFTLLETTGLPAPRILVSGVDVDLLLQPSPNESPAPDGGLDSTADSSIGQSTNQTAAPASGNVPISTPASSSSSSSKASVIAPAIVVPVVVVLAALAAFFLWRRHRRARLAPSAAFRADHADAVEAMERQGGTVGLGGTGTVQIPSASASLPAQSSSYFPLDEKRPLNP